MRLSRFHAFACAFALLIAGTTNLAPAQSAPQRIAIARPFVILQQMSEFKDLKTKFDNETQQLNADLKRRTDAIDLMIQQRTSTFKPDTPQFDEASAKIDQAKTDLEAWKTMVRLSSDRQQKKNIRLLWMKIEAATDVVAQKNKIDLVLTDNRQSLPNVEESTYQGFLATLAQRNVLYAGKQIDLSDQILVKLEADYAANARAAGAGIGGAPGPVQGPPPQQQPRQTNPAGNH